MIKFKYIYEFLVILLFFVIIISMFSFLEAKDTITPQTYHYEGKCKEKQDYIDDLKFKKSVDQNIKGYPVFWDMKINIMGFNVVKEENNYCYVIIKYI